MQDSQVPHIWLWSTFPPSFLSYPTLPIMLQRYRPSCYSSKTKQNKKKRERNMFPLQGLHICCSLSKMLLLGSSHVLILLIIQSQVPPPLTIPDNPTQSMLPLPAICITALTTTSTNIVQFTCLVVASQGTTRTFSHIDCIYRTWNSSWHPGEA